MGGSEQPVSVSANVTMESHLRGLQGDGLRLDFTGSKVARRHEKCKGRDHVKL